MQLTSTDTSRRKQELTGNNTDPLFSPRGAVQFGVTNVASHSAEIPLRCVVVPVRQILPVTRSNSEPLSPALDVVDSPTLRHQSSMQLASFDEPTTNIFSHIPQQPEFTRSIRSPVESLDGCHTDVLSSASIRHPPSSNAFRDREDSFIRQCSQGHTETVDRNLSNVSSNQMNSVGAVNNETKYPKPVTSPINTGTTTDIYGPSPPTIDIRADSELYSVNGNPIDNQRVQLQNPSPWQSPSDNQATGKALRLMKKVDQLEKYGEALQISLTNKMDEIEILLREKMEKTELCDKQRDEIDKLKREVERQARKVAETELNLAQATKHLRAMTADAHDLRQALEAQINKTENTMRDLRSVRDKVTVLETLNISLQEQIDRLQAPLNVELVRHIDTSDKYALVGRGPPSPEKPQHQERTSATATRRKPTPGPSGQEQLFSAILTAFNAAPNVLLDTLLQSLIQTVKNSLRVDRLPALDSPQKVWVPGKDFQWGESNANTKTSTDGTFSLNVTIYYNSTLYDMFVSTLCVRSFTRLGINLHNQFIL